MQVAGHVLWPRAAWLYQEAVTHRGLKFLCQGDCKLLVSENNCFCGKNIP